MGIAIYWQGWVYDFATEEDARAAGFTFPTAPPTQPLHPTTTVVDVSTGEVRQVSSKD